MPEKKVVKHFVHATYSPCQPQAGAPVINIQSTLRTAPELCTNVSLAVLFSSNGSLYTVSLQSDMCIHIHIFHIIDTLVEQKKFKKIETAVRHACQGNLSTRRLGHARYRLVSGRPTSNFNLY